MLLRMTSHRPTPRDVRAALTAAARERISILDGAMGTQIQGARLRRGRTSPGDGACAIHGHPQQGKNDLLILTQPEAIEEIHFRYAMAGADIIETNTFSSTAIAQADYGAEALVYELNRDGAALVRRAAARAEAKDGKRRFVAGALGPTNRTASISPDVNDPGFRAVSFDDLRMAYGEQLRGLLDGGADLILIETIFDTLNAKAAIFACEEVFAEKGVRLPLMISGTITDLSGRTLSGQTPTAFWHSVRHARPFTVGLNCALGADAMRAHLAEIAGVADTFTCAYPQRRPAERVRPVRRGSGLHGGAARGVRPRGADQRRRRLLRHHARPYPRDRRGGRPLCAARRPREAAADAARRARALHADAGDPVRERRRAHERHRLGAVPQARHRGRLRRRRSRSRATRWRTGRRSSTSTWTRG